MFSKWPIRVKLLIGLGLLLLVVVSLCSSGLYATYAYRSLVKSLSWRAVELPLAAELSQHVGDLRITLSEVQSFQARTFPHRESDGWPLQVRIVREQFRTQLLEVEETLARYRRQLQQKWEVGLEIADNQREWETVHKIEAALLSVHEANRDEDWMLDDVKVGRLDAELERLQALTAELPSHLHNKLRGFAAQVRLQYRALFVCMWISSISAALIFALFVKLFYQWILLPLRILIGGSRKVAAGQFGYRIHLEAKDEMAELAEAMNSMTDRFQAIRDDLDRQVKERTRQVVRNEQLASVGFLAAGVAHEINNPLASIALCAESMESRMREVLHSDDPQHAIISNYLQMIQNEAFRCKEITEKLLDFSRTGELKRQDAELSELVGGVIEMVGHLGKYQGKHIEFSFDKPVVAAVNTQEIKQVVLNLLTNALDCVGQDGSVWIELGRQGGMAELTVKDNGCGMEPEVIEHVFEPFFTRRHAAQGTGLGLSISYRIIADHQGEIEAFSLGPGRGSTFRVRLPLAANHKEERNQYQAA